MITKQELYRQFVHALLGIVIVIGYYFDIITPLVLFLLLIIAGITSILIRRIKIPVISWFIEKLEREDVKKDFPGKGMFFFFLGTLLCVKLFSKDIALASIMILALGDSVSHIVGVQFGRLRNIFNIKGKKLLEGTIAGIIAGFVGALIFVPLTEALIGSLTAMIMEVIDIYLNDKQIDDNLIVPLVAGTAIYLARIYLFI